MCARSDSEHHGRARLLVRRLEGRLGRLGRLHLSLPGPASRTRILKRKCRIPRTSTGCSSTVESSSSNACLFRPSAKACIAKVSVRACFPSYFPPRMKSSTLPSLRRHVLVRSLLLQDSRNVPSGEVLLKRQVRELVLLALQNEQEETALFESPSRILRCCVCHDKSFVDENQTLPKPEALRRQSSPSL